VRPLEAYWFPDGKRVLVLGEERGHAPRLYSLPVGGGTPKPISPEGDFGFRFAISPDGKFVAARVPGGKIALYPEEGEPKSILELEVKGLPAQFSADGRYLYTYKVSLPCTIYRLDLLSRRQEIWKQFNPPDPVGVGGCSLVKVTPDGRSYAYRYGRWLSTLYLIEGLR
jgi:Tol biopolymer transport system component